MEAGKIGSRLSWRVPAVDSISRSKATQLDWMKARAMPNPDRLKIPPITRAYQAARRRRLRRKSC